MLGLDALAGFLHAIPSDTDFCLVVVLDVPGEWDAQASLEMLESLSALPIELVTESRPFEAGRVLIVPGDKVGAVAATTVHVRRVARTRMRRVAIDLMFRNLALLFGDEAIGVLLAGDGNDGADGLAHIRHAGGLTLAQAPFEAGCDEMPRHAIAAGAVDVVLPAADLPASMQRFASASPAILLPSALGRNVVRAPATAYPLPGIREILRMLAQRCGRDFSPYKTMTVLRRTQRRARLHGVSDLAAYARVLETETQEAAALAHDIQSTVTGFFRDPSAYAVLESITLRGLTNVLRAMPDSTLRAWCVGCSTGEEAFSLAIALADAAGADACDRLRIFASDGDPAAIVTARAAMYPLSTAADVSRSRMRRFLEESADRYQVKKVVRERVVFAVHDLFRDPPFSGLHLIVCRTLLPELKAEARDALLRTFHRSLLPEGYLFVGREGLGETGETWFRQVDGTHGLYRARVNVPGQRSTPLGLATARETPLNSAANSSEGARKVAFADVHRRAIERFSPPSVVVTGSYEVVHLSPDANRYVREAHTESGPRHLLTMVSAALRRELIEALTRVISTGQPAQSRRVTLGDDVPGAVVRITVRPFHDDQSRQDLMLVVFHEVTDATPAASGNALVSSRRADGVAALEAEIAQLQERLADESRRARRSNERLMTANEALEAANDELRMSTAALVAGKDRLHAINEELTTVNVALREAAEETSDIHDDLQNLIRSSDLSAIRVDRSLAVQWFTPHARQVMDVALWDRGRPLAQMTHRLQYPELVADVARTVASTSRIEREIRSTDGSWFLTRVVPYRTFDNLVDGAVIIFVDITERRLVDARVSAAQARMRLVAETTQEYAFIAMNDAGIITSWNAGAERIFGFTAAEMHGKPYASIFTRDEQELGIPARELTHARRTGHSFDDRWRSRKDGSRFYCSGVLYPLTGQGTPGFAKISRDLTTRHREQTAREQALQRTLASNELKDVFFAMMSHELRHPLNLIQLNMELLGRGPDVMGVPAANRAVDAVKHAVRDQARIIDELLDIARISTGKLKITCTPVDLAALVARCISAVSADASGKGVLVAASGLNAPLLLSADRTRLEQAVGNLLANAIKFTPRGGHVFVTLVDDGNEARLDVADTGVGIAPESTDSIFTLLSQLDPQHATRSTSGLGVGLALSRHFVEAHGGRLQVRSDGPGKGATFTIRLRLSEDPVALEAAATPALQRLQGVRIVLAEDSRDALEALSLLLEDEGAKVLGATTGQAALDLLQNDDIDVLIADIRMPGMNGRELVRRLRKAPRNAGIPAIAMTGLGAHGSAEPRTLEGFDTWLCKPVSVDRVVAAVLEHLQ
ncbi:CheR family methyltransferase [Pigmentiphaga litoralis]|uniref:CheR family methyltransferase n=1 Tax=Pigmentiphaga litoralis TaxID=516702 RepID=UPI003B43721F